LLLLLLLLPYLLFGRSLFFPPVLFFSKNVFFRSSAPGSTNFTLLKRRWQERLDSNDSSVTAPDAAGGARNDKRATTRTTRTTTAARRSRRGASGRELCVASILYSTAFGRHWRDRLACLLRSDRANPPPSAAVAVAAAAGPSLSLSRRRTTVQRQGRRRYGPVLPVVVVVAFDYYARIAFRMDEYVRTNERCGCGKKQRTTQSGEYCAWCARARIYCRGVLPPS